MAMKTTKVCVTCQQELPKTKEYWYWNKETNKANPGSCKKCQSSKNAKRQRRKGRPFEVKKVPAKPYQYKDPKQKEYVEKVMKACGWTWNEKEGFWWKEGIREKNGTWHFKWETPKVGKGKLQPGDKEKILEEYRNGTLNREDWMSLRNVKIGPIDGIINRRNEKKIGDKQKNG